MFFLRLLLLVVPLVYMSIIWIQTRHFDPESVYMLSTQIDMRILLIIGAGFELAHLFEFGLLYTLLMMAFLIFGKLSPGKEVLAAIVAIGYGLVDELHQYYIPFRSFSLIDLVKNCIGVMALWYLVHKSYGKKTSRLGMFLRKITYKRKDRTDITM